MLWKKDSWVKAWSLAETNPAELAPPRPLTIDTPAMPAPGNTSAKITVLRESAREQIKRQLWLSALGCAGVVWCSVWFYIDCLFRTDIWPSTGWSFGDSSGVFDYGMSGYYLDPDQQAQVFLIHAAAFLSTFVFVYWLQSRRSRRIHSDTYKLMELTTLPGTILEAAGSTSITENNAGDLAGAIARAAKSFDLHQKQLLPQVQHRGLNRKQLFYWKGDRLIIASRLAAICDYYLAQSAR
jgi:hypothetical protein